MKNGLIFGLAIILLTQCHSHVESSTEQIALKFSNGNLFCEGTHKVSPKGRKNRIGIWKFYYPNGLLENLMEYDNVGTLLTMKKYNEEGSLLYTETNSDKQIIETYFYENGKIEIETITEIKTDDDGDETYYSITNEFHENGQLKQKRKYINDVPDGDSQIWDNKGNLLLKYKYKRGLIILPDSSNSVSPS